MQVSIESSYDDIHKDVESSQPQEKKEYGLSEEDTANLCLWIKVIE